MPYAIVKPWMQTYSGKKFDLLEPTQESIDINDIAHALSNLCRYTGHTEHFYSVAQHSIIAAANVPEENKLCALLHDATEAYINDISRPLKALLPEYRKIEDRIWHEIADKFYLPYEMPESIKKADIRLLATEKRDLLTVEPDEWTIINDVEPYPEKIEFLDNETVKERFLNIFKEYSHQNKISCKETIR